MSTFKTYYFQGSLHILPTAPAEVKSTKLPAVPSVGCAYIIYGEINKVTIVTMCSSFFRYNTEKWLLKTAKKYYSKDLTKFDETCFIKLFFYEHFKKKVMLVMWADEGNWLGKTPL
ncbi:MAG: hypothetical protein IPJ81_07770 [Chitinophagaceae bacterium]|nr:hypothetical protein [Chitinophagaceae bacterium]